MGRAQQLLATWGATEQQASTIDDALLEHIHESLLMAFNNPVNQQKFMSMQNNNSPFDGLSPLAYIEQHPERARQIAEHVLSLGMPW
ncbi:hypothetical protein AB6C62_19150 [Vibrio splendidus]|uniref:hypothetical protein n=1 Tax=Vibrio splendidus TaxID=29497 RepID=UPI000C84DDBD|nr:hypothetical protein [Vibrio splendidus]PMO20108.1 hypothetical protein BCT15_18255 [Vibrio splendidus]